MIDYENDYYLIPKALYTDPEYAFLSDRARLTYAILCDEQRRAAERGQFDENGDIYIDFSNKAFLKLLGCSKNTFLYYRDSLELCGLIECEQRVSKTRGSLPTRIYVKEI